MTDEVAVAPAPTADNVAPAAPAPTPSGDWKTEAGLADNASFDKFNSVADLAKSYSEVEGLARDSIRIPTSEAGEEQWNAFNEKVLGVPGMLRMPNDGESRDSLYQQLGRPTDAGGYQLDKVEGFNDDDESNRTFREVAHGLGLSSEQANGVYKSLGEASAAKTAAMNEAADKGMENLRASWGQGFDHKLAAAEHAAHMLQDRIPGIGDYFDSMAKQGYDASFIQLMSLVADLTGEKGAAPNIVGAGGMTPDEAMQMASDIRGNPDHPYNNEMDPAHDAAQRKMADLYKVAYKR